MTYIRKLDLFRLLLTATILACLAFGYFSTTSIFFTELLLVAAALLAATLLSDILIAWLFLLSSSIAVVLLVAGVVYLTSLQQLVLLFSFPLVLALTSRIHALKREILSAVKDEQKNASKHYQQLLTTAKQNQTWPVEAILVNWAHSSHFYHMNPSAYRDMLRTIYQTLLDCLTEDMTVYYVSNGSFLILLSGQDSAHHLYFDTVIKPKLSKLRFHNLSISQETQYRHGYVAIDSSNMETFRTSSELLKQLNRQLETDIIVEY